MFSSLGCQGQNQNKTEDSGDDLVGKPLAACAWGTGFGPPDSWKAKNCFSYFSVAVIKKYPDISNLGKKGLCWLVLLERLSLS